MEKEKILQRYRQEGVDEGREEVNRRGDDAGFYAMCVLALLLMIYQAFTGQVFGDVAAMLFVFCSVGAFARYRTDRDRSALGMGIFPRCEVATSWRETHVVNLLKSQALIKKKLSAEKEYSKAETAKRIAWPPQIKHWRFQLILLPASCGRAL